MKICYIANGESIHTKRWVKWFADKGHEVHLISSSNSNVENVSFHHVNIIKGYYIPRLRYIRKIKQIIKTVKPDILHAHQVLGYGMYGALSGFHPFVVSPWGSDIAIAPERSMINKLIVRFVLKKACMVYVGDEPAKERVLELVGGEKRIFIQPFGVDTHRFSPDANSENLQEKLGIKNRPSVFICRWLKPQYYIDVLIKAIPYVLKKLPDTKFIISSDGPLKDELENLTKKLAISKNVVFVGRIPHDDMHRYIASMDVYTDTVYHPTNKGGGGIGVGTMEAMSCGVPQILVRSVSIDESKEWFHGLCYERENSEELAEKIVFLLENNKLREEIGRKSRETALKIGDWDKNMKVMEKNYERLVMEGSKI